MRASLARCSLVSCRYVRPWTATPRVRRPGQYLAAAHHHHRSLVARRVVASQQHIGGRVGVEVEPDMGQPVARDELKQPARLRLGPRTDDAQPGAR
jgi:hypothetical protein